MVIANAKQPASKHATKHDRRSQPRTPLAPLVPLATLRARVDQEHSGDFYIVRNSRSLLGYRDHYREAGFKSFKALFANVTAQKQSAISSHDLSRRLRPARVIAPEEAWESNLGPAALRIICRHPKEERAVFFALGRRTARARSAGQRPEVPTSRALRALSDEVRAIDDAAQRVALLRERLQVRPDECVAPLVPKGELGEPRETPPPPSLMARINRLVGTTGFLASQVAEVRRALDGYDGPEAQEIQRKLGTVKDRLGVEILDNVDASYQLIGKALEGAADPARPEPRQKKKRPAATAAPPPPPEPVIRESAPPIVTPPPSPAAPPPSPAATSAETATPTASAATAAPSPTEAAPPSPTDAAPSPSTDAPAAAPEPPTAEDHAAPAAQVIVAGGTPPGWVRAEWLVLVAALNVILNDEEAYRLNDLLQMLALENCHRYANHEEIRALINKAQQRAGALPPSVVPHFKRWMEWIGALNVRSRHYLCVAMIIGLRRANWRTAIYAMRTGQLPKDMRDDIRRAGNTIPHPYQKWRKPQPDAEARP